MSLTVTLLSTIPGLGANGPELSFELAIVPSGTYPTGGDTLNLNGLLPGIGAGQIPKSVFIAGQAGFMYQYVNGTKMADGKMKVLVATTGGTNLPLGEHTNVTYVAGVSGDTIRARVTVETNRD